MTISNIQHFVTYGYMCIFCITQFHLDIFVITIILIEFNQIKRFKMRLFNVEN